MAETPGGPPPTTTDTPAPPALPGGVGTSQARDGLKKIVKDFGKGTKDLLRFVFVEQRAERRQELVESLRFYVTYK